uniref:Uncharacterized protein n=1 Tax=Amphimedon queenslandica TaxID=400682 RepID=A0A1X7UUR7_AMPQE
MVAIQTGNSSACKSLMSARIIPKKVEDIGAFEFDVEVEQILLPPTSDTSSSSDRSRSPILVGIGQGFSHQ